MDFGDQHQSGLAVQHEPAGDRGHARAQVRPHHQHLVDQRTKRASSARPTIRPRSRRAGFAKTLAQEGARLGVTVNAIGPGYINTEKMPAVPKEVPENLLPTIPIGRRGEPEEIGRCVVFLASDDAGLITGSTLTANGRQYIT